uniref:Uncharacterized protein n=1 Tax=Anopheles farauti TaxID=69004 RepID=A0A182QV62_9DIPT
MSESRGCGTVQHGFRRTVVPKGSERGLRDRPSGKWALTRAERCQEESDEDRKNNGYYYNDNDFVADIVVVVVIAGVAVDDIVGAFLSMARKPEPANHQHGDEVPPGLHWGWGAQNDDNC